MEEMGKVQEGVEKVLTGQVLLDFAAYMYTYCVLDVDNFTQI